MNKLILITSAALEQALMGSGFSEDTMHPRESDDVVKVVLSEEITGYRAKVEGQGTYFALVNVGCLENLYVHDVKMQDAYRRIARVVTSMQTPPVHLPRQWSEYHFRNLMAFFAAPRDITSHRWISEIDREKRTARFDFLSDVQSEVELKNFSPSPWPFNYDQLVDKLISHTVTADKSLSNEMAAEVDLSVIGSGSVVKGLSFDEWKEELTPSQKDVLKEALNKSIRIVGPAGSGKTLALCMRALRVARDEDVIARESKILIATHSWAMSERIDGILTELNSGIFPDRITVFPLLSLLDYHTGGIGQKHVDVIGNDSSDGRRQTILLLSEVLSNYRDHSARGLSIWIDDALNAKSDSRAMLDLIGYLYEEITGVISATGVSPDDSESIRSYLTGLREDWMPPFDSFMDRQFVLDVYKDLLKELIDREAITTDQFILDAIRVLETFSWRMRKETEGYDYIFVDELQLFDPQERASLELLARSRQGVPFVTAEDPSQGVFSTLNGRHSSPTDETVYLDTVHRFDKGIFEFISYIYRKFPLNATPLKTESTVPEVIRRPVVYNFRNQSEVLAKVVDLSEKITRASEATERLCVATLGDYDLEVSDALIASGLNTTRLSSFDDIEQLAYTKKSIVVSPWEYVGGTQFSSVIVVIAGIRPASSQFSRLREMISIYLACSRAANQLHIICENYVPQVLQEAGELRLIVMDQNHE